ncbi:helix-turn-helix transcriptional regulator [Pseudoramibacter alactolyticus]|jgi:predicted DNA-binding transcriptional regulator AlpA|uniref:helix-turn-helix transcriptional regulator n=1 Tax=Pseudoramibacter alactolyticus TaxID=113287 RepID=UPI0036F2C481
MNDQLLTISDLKKRYHCSNDIIYELVKDPTFPSFRLNSRKNSKWYIRKDDLESWEKDRYRKTE